MLEISEEIKEIDIRVKSIDLEYPTETIKQRCKAIKEKIKTYYRFDELFDGASGEEADEILDEQYYIGIEIMHDYNLLEKEMKKNKYSK